MNQTIKIGIIGDYTPEKVSHPATNAAISHAADALGVKAEVDWLPTPSFTNPAALKKLEQYDAVWASSGSPYKSDEGMLAAIRYARELKRPFIGT
jgi:CTP synthase (UTP-ammonia lyase)